MGNLSDIHPSSNCQTRLRIVVKKLFSSWETQCHLAVQICFCQIETQLTTWAMAVKIQVFGPNYT